MAFCSPLSFSWENPLIGAAPGVSPFLMCPFVVTCPGLVCGGPTEPPVDCGWIPGKGG